MGYQFVQVRVETEEEFDRAFAHFASKGISSEGAEVSELTYRGPGYVKFNSMLGYTWYSDMSLAFLVEDDRYENPLFFKKVEGFVENF